MPHAAVVLDETWLGLTWTQREPLRRSSHALVDGGRVWVVDPTFEASVLERVQELGEPAAVVQLLDRHNRDCARVAEALRVPHLRVPTALPASPFRVVPVVDVPVWREVALYWPERDALIVAEALGTSPAYLPGPSGAGVSIGLRLWPPRSLAGFDPHHLLVGHGAALHPPGAAAAVREAMERSRRDLPRALRQLPVLLRRR